MMQSSPQPRPSVTTDLWRPALGLLIDYLRWTQLVPMVLAWAFLLLMVAALVVTNFQQQSFMLIERGIESYESLFGPVDAPGQQPAEDALSVEDPQPGSESEALRFSEAEVRPWVMKAWALLALAGWLLGLLRASLFGPREPMSLKRKLALAGLAAALASLLCFIPWLFGTETFHGSAIGWIALFVGIPLLVWCVSAWALAIAHLLDLLRRKLEGGPDRVRADA